MHAFSPGHMHCSPGSLVYMESLQSSCFFLYNLLLPMHFGLSAADFAQHLLAQLCSMSFKLFQWTLHRRQLHFWESFKVGKQRQMPKWSLMKLWGRSKSTTTTLWEQGLYCPFWYQEVTLRMQTFLPQATTELGLGCGSQVNKNAKILSWQRLADFFFIKYSPGCCTVFIWFQFQKCWFWQFLMPA